MKEPMTRKLISVPDTLWQRIQELQRIEIAKVKRVISESEVVRQALLTGVGVLENKRSAETDLDDT